MPTLDDLIADAPVLHVRPDAVATLMGVIDDPLVSVSELLPVVERDPGLTAGLLKLCNSALYNLERSIGTPREALIMVGNVAFARLCFTLSLKPAFDQRLDAYGLDTGALWQHSLATAYGASFLIKAAGQRELADRAFTAGLLHDVGKLVLEPALAAMEQQQPPVGNATAGCEAERGRVGHDHAEAGAALLDNWCLPAEIVAAVRWHHHPGEAGDHHRLAVAVDVADRVSHMVATVRQAPQAVDDWLARTCDPLIFARESVETLLETLGSGPTDAMALLIGHRA